MKRTIAVLAAVAVVVTGATVAFAQTSDSTTTTTAPAEDATPMPDHGFRFGPLGNHQPGQALDEVLSDLVSKGTITQDQSDAITAGLEAKRTEAQAARDEARQQAQETRAQLESFWADGVLTVDEIQQLPNADWILSPDSPFADALADGQITKDEMQALRPLGRRGHHSGWGLGDAPTTTTPGA